MTPAAALLELSKLEADLRFQSTNPYHNSRKERHVRELLAEYAERAGDIARALAPAKVKRVRRGK